MSKYPQRFRWTQFQIAAEMENHRDDPDWNPIEDGPSGHGNSWWVVKTITGKLIPPPQSTQLPDQ